MQAGAKVCSTLLLGVQGLLQLGSGVNARDKGGATPLFVACESGHAACAKLLLQAGADVLLRNSAGEAPLYIAALRGEMLVVDALLHHMHQEGICWQVRPSSLLILTNTRCVQPMPPVRCLLSFAFTLMCTLMSAK